MSLPCARFLNRDVRKSFSGQRRLCALVGLFGLVATATASAQIKPVIPTGSHIPTKPRILKGVASGQYKKLFSKCVYSTYTKNAQTFLRYSDPLEVDYKSFLKSKKNIYRFLGTNECLGDNATENTVAIQITMTPSILRSMLEQEAYLVAYPAAPTLPDNSKEILDREYFSTGDKLVLAKSLAAFADCIVFHNTTGADAVLRTLPDSDEESVAARALVPTLKTCLVEGNSISLRTENIRTLVADGLWTRYVRNSNTVAIATK